LTSGRLTDNGIARGGAVVDSTPAVTRHIMKSRVLSAIAMLGALAFIAALLFRPTAEPDKLSEASSLVVGSGPSSAVADTAGSSPFGVVDTAPEPLHDPTDSIDPAGTVGTTQPAIALSNDTMITAWDSPLSDADLASLVARLKADPVLFLQLVDEFRQETDPARKKQLASVLGEVGGEQVTLLASELIFSGDSAARTLGMDLLQDVQPGNAQARDIVSGMLATEVDADVLVESLTALSLPGDVDSDSRAYLSDQIAWLTTHTDDGVRSISLDLLSRWSEDGRYTNTLLSGLDDDSEYVRTSAAYALAGHEDSSQAVIEGLLRSLRNASETTRVKRAAIQALRSMPLSPDQRLEVDALERVLNTRPR